jgi:hypothetical protein
MKRPEKELMEAILTRIRGALTPDVPVYANNGIPDNPFNRSAYFVNVVHLGSVFSGGKNCPAHDHEILFQVDGQSQDMDIVSEIMNSISTTITTSNSQTPNLLTGLTNFTVDGQWDEGADIQKLNARVIRGNLRIRFLTKEN